MTTIIIEPSMHKGSMTSTNVKKKDIPPKERYIMRKERAGEVYDKQTMEIVSKTWGIIEFQLLHNHICTTRKRIKQKRSAKRRPFCCLEVQKSSDNL